MDNKNLIASDLFEVKRLQEKASVHFHISNDNVFDCCQQSNGYLS